MTTVHVIPTGETPEHHTLGNCPCRPRRHARRRPDGTLIDHVHLHRATDETP